MEGYCPDRHSASSQRLQQFRREVEACCGGGGTAGDLRVYGLVPFPILKLSLDVGGQGHLSQVVQYLQKDPLVLEADQPVAPLQFLCNLRGEFPVAEGELGSRPQLPPWTDQALPHPVSPVDQQQYLAGPAAGEPMAQEPGGEDTGIVEDETVPRREQGGQIVEMAVGAGSGVLVQHHQTGGVPPLQRRLGRSK